MAQKLNVDTSIVDYLKSTGEDSSFGARTNLAKSLGITNYSGSAEQNISLLNTLKNKGKTTAPTNTNATLSTNQSGIDNAINKFQGTDFESFSTKEEPQTRRSTSYADTISQITSGLNKGLPEKPETISLTETYKSLREDQGLNELESQLTTLQTQQRDLIAANKARTDAEKAKPVAMNVIAGRVSEEERQDQERLTAINSSIQTVTSQLQTKYNAVDTIMKLTGQDYDNAVNAYDKQFSQNLQIINLAKDIADQEKSDVERAEDNARANAQIVINTMNNNGTTFSDLSSDQQINLTKLGVQSGLGANFFSDVMKVSAGKDILTTITSDDKTQATIVYKDGTTKNISTGFSGGTGTQKLSILDVSRYNELYPDAGVTAGDTESTANAKVNALNTPETDIRALVISAKDAKNSYQDVVASINEDDTIEDKETATKIAQEVYGVSQETKRQTQRQTQLESEISALKESYAQRKLPENVDVNDLIERELRSKGYSNQEIIDSSLGSFVDKTITSISNFLFK